MNDGLKRDKLNCKPRDKVARQRHTGGLFAARGFTAVTGPNDILMWPDNLV